MKKLTMAVAAVAAFTLFGVAHGAVVGDNLLANGNFDEPIISPGRLNTNQGNGYGNLENVGSMSPGNDEIKQLVPWEVVVQQETTDETDGTVYKSYGNSFFFTVPNSNISKVSANSREGKNQRIAMLAPRPSSESGVVYVPKRYRQKVTVAQGGVYQVSFWHGPGGWRGGNSWADTVISIEIGSTKVFSRKFCHQLYSQSSIATWEQVFSEPFTLEAGEYDFAIYSEMAEPYADVPANVVGVDTIDDIKLGLFQRTVQIETIACTVQDSAADEVATSGTTRQLTVTPEDGCFFVGWRGDAITDANRYDNPLSLTIPEGAVDVCLSAKCVATNANLLANANFELAYGDKEGGGPLNRVKTLAGAAYPYHTIVGWSCVGPGDGYGSVCYAILGGNPVGSDYSRGYYNLALVAPVGAQVGNGLEQTFYAPVRGYYDLTLDMRSLNFNDYCNGQRCPIYIDGKKVAVFERQLLTAEDGTVSVNTAWTTEPTVRLKLSAGEHQFTLMAGQTTGTGPALTFVDTVNLVFSERVPSKGICIYLR